MINITEIVPGQEVQFSKLENKELLAAVNNNTSQFINTVPNFRHRFKFWVIKAVTSSSSITTTIKKMRNIKSTDVITLYNIIAFLTRKKKITYFPILVSKSLPQLVFKGKWNNLNFEGYYNRAGNLVIYQIKGKKKFKPDYIPSTIIGIFTKLPSEIPTISLPSFTTSEEMLTSISLENV